MAEAVNFNGIQEYVDEKRLPLLSEATLRGVTLDYINIMTDVKYKSALNILDMDVALQSGAECGWSEKGTTTFSQRMMDVEPIKVNMAWCPKDFRKYWMNYQFRIAAGKETLPFEEYFVEEILRSVKEQVETLVWQGDKAAGANDTLKLIDGLLKQAEDAIDVTIGGTDAYADVMAVYAAIPEAVLPNAVIFVGNDTFRSLVVKLLDKAPSIVYNNPDATNGAITSQVFVLPGTNTRVVGVAGLNGTGKIVAADPRNLYYGTDVEGDDETFDMWYEKGDDEFRFKLEFLAGTQIAFPAEVVVGAKA